MNIFLVLTISVTSTVDLGVSGLATIESDEVTLDIARNQTQWTGDVVIRQAQYELRADRVILTHDENGKAIRVEAIGNPVVATGPFEGQLAEAQGRVVLYERDLQQVSISGDSKLKLPKNSVSAENIVYNFIQKKILATGTKRKHTKLQLYPDDA